MRKLYVVAILALMFATQSCKKKEGFSVHHCDSCTIILSCGTSGAGTGTSVDLKPPGTESTLSWVAPSDPNWKVDFGNDRPCDEQTLHQGHNSCKVTRNPGIYNYGITLNHCPGRDQITIAP